MTSRDATQIPRAGTGNGNPAVDSDRVKAPVVGVNRLLDFGGDGSRDASSGSKGVGNLAPTQDTGKLEETTSHKKQKRVLKDKLELPEIAVSAAQLSRAPSNTSLASAGSCASAFSDMTAIDLESCNKDRQRIVALRSREADRIRLIISEVETMLNACQTQKNVSMTIKEGLKKVKELAVGLQREHQNVDKEEKDYERGLVATEEGRQARKKIRRRIEGQLLRNAVLDSVTQKRHRSPEASPERQEEKKGKRKKTTMPKDREMIQDLTGKPKASGASKDRASKKTVLVKANSGETYATVLGKIRKEVNPGDTRSTVLRARPTGRGDILIELSSGSDQEAFANDIRRVVQGMAEIKANPRKTTLEICDLDPLAEEDEIITAIRAGLRNEEAVFEVKLLKQNQRGLKMAVVILTDKEAKELLRLQHVRVGLTSCRIRRRLMVVRCFRCLGFGHIRKDCREEDRSSLCYKCGEAGHSAKECKERAQCLLCKAEEKRFDHVSGSGGCDVFRRALEAERKKERWKPTQRT